MTAVRTPTVPAAAAATDHAAITSRLREAERAVQECLEALTPERPTTYSPADAESFSKSAPEVSVVMPCLNEADTLEVCIEKAQRSMNEAGIYGEVIVADNGSTDGCQELARALGARVINVEEKGYGSALMGGIQAARGKYVIMGDADDSYDFLEVPKFVEQLRSGSELAQGCRLPSGGGTILPGAMPLLHRWWGNPMFSWMVRGMFHAPIHDVYCGLRGFTRELYDRLDMRCTGMEFATEMIIKCSLFGAKTAEVPTTLHPDGRKAHAPHLRTFRDGWRTLRFFLMYSPKWLFMVPGVLLMLLGVTGYALALPGATVMGASLDAHTLLVASLTVLLGSQLLQFALFAKTFAISEGLMPPSERLTAFFHRMPLERWLLVGGGAFVIGGAMIAKTFTGWWSGGFGALDYAATMRQVIPGVTLAALGCQAAFAGFFLSILRTARK